MSAWFQINLAIGLIIIETVSFIIRDITFAGINKVNSYWTVKYKVRNHNNLVARSSSKHLIVAMFKSIACCYGVSCRVKKIDAIRKSTPRTNQII